MIRRPLPFGRHGRSGRVVAGGLRLALVALAAVALIAPVAAQSPVPAAAKPATAVAESFPPWAALTAAQQTALRPLQAEWRQLDAARKSKWLAVASRLPSMPDAERQRMQERMAEWARLTPAERGRARQNYQASRTLRPEERQALWESYRSLPPEKKQELAARTTPVPATAKSLPGGDLRAATGGKRNIVTTSPPPPNGGKPVSPTMVQARPGATTTLLTRPASPPVHHQAGLPKIAATHGFVNPSTLLPNRGPQGAATSPPSPPAAVHDASQ